VAAKDAKALSAGVARLAKDFKLTNGKVALDDATFEKWIREHLALPQEEKQRRAPEVVALAVRFLREGKAAARDGVDQLCLLTGALLGEVKAKQAMKSAGVGWGQKAKSTGKGWGR
jgi:hypothetical protein